MKGLKKLMLLAAVAGANLAVAQPPAPAAPAEPDTRVVPRNEYGHVSFAGTKENPGNWNGLLGSLSNRQPGQQRGNIPENLSYDQVPFQDWARELHAARSQDGGANDPHTRCKPSGGARMFQTPYGMEILDAGDTVFMMGIGSPHSWRQIFMDGREHPADLKPGFYGHSVGHWEGDTLVIDTVGFVGDEYFWISRDGYPHTTQLHTIEKLSRPDFDTLRYELTVDDPGAYTQPWTGGFFLTFGEGNQPFDYLCQENNLDPVRMTGTNAE
jgi:hypothetical protein